MSQYEAMFGIESFMAWGLGELDRVSGELYDLGSHIRGLHESLLRRGKSERKRAVLLYNAIQGTNFTVGECVLVWTAELAALEGNKIAPPWIVPYVVQEKLTPTGYPLISDQGDRTARVHAKRLRNIIIAARETGDTRDGVFPETLRRLQKIKGVQEAVSNNGEKTSLFQLQLGGRSPPRWMREEDLLEAAVAA